MKKKSKTNKIKKESVGVGISSGIIAGLCCIAPLIIILFGLGTVSFALSISQYRPYFLGLGILFVVSAIVLHLRKKSKTCDMNCFSVEGVKKEKRFIATVIITMLTIYGISLYVMIPLLSPVVYGSLSTKIDNSLETSADAINEENLRQTNLKINGLSCPGCASGVEYQLKQLDGVVQATVKYPEGSGEVIYDLSKITKEEIVNSDAFSFYTAEIIDDKVISEPVVRSQEEFIGEDGDVHEFNITAFQWGFDPSTIEVHKDARVILYMTSTDVTHGFAIPEFNVYGKIESGKTTVIMFVADKVGEFTFYCSIPCGAGHADMKGQIIVK